MTVTLNGLHQEHCLIMRYEKFIRAEGASPEYNETAREIIRAAKKLFLERGYNAVSLREIASEAGVNLGLIPYYFMTKDNLANKVYTELTNEMYESLGETYHLDALSHAAQMYVYTVLSLEKADEAFQRFFSEYLEAAHGNEEASEAFIRMSEQVIADYGVHVTPAENEAYLLAMKGAERLLNIRRLQHRVNLTTRQILDIILSDYLYNIGLTDRQIADVIAESRAELDKIG